MLSDNNIEFGINISTGMSVANIKAVNTALSDFSHTALIAASRQAQAIEKARRPFPAWSDAMRGTADVFKVSAKNISSSMEDAASKTKKPLHDWTETSASLRYALYDVSSSAAQASAALVAFPAAAAVAAISAEREFSNVARVLNVSGKQANDLKNQFIELSQALPTSFKEVTRIGTLAGQLGIANEQISSFTENIIKFSTVTNMTSEASATALARLNDLIPSVNGNYENLSSSILKVGVNSAATESEIVAVAQQIAPIANTFNFSADAVIGFAGAMASLKIPPELSRGVLQRTFAIVNQAISSNSADLDKWGSVIGKSGKEFKDAWLGNSVMAFTDVLRAIGQQGGAAEGTLANLGITASRDAATLKRLAQSVDSTLMPALSDAANGYKDGSEQQKQFDFVAATLAERLKKLASNFQNFLATAGSGISVFGGLIDVTNGFLGMLTDVINNPFGKWFFLAVGAGSALLAALLAIVSVAARFRAGVIAVNQAIIGMGTHFKTVRAEAVATGTNLKTLGGIANVTGLSFKTLGIAMKSTLVGLGISVAVGLIAGLIEMLGQSAQTSSEKIDTMFGSLSELNAAMAEDARMATITGESVISYQEHLRNAGKTIDKSGNVIDAETKARGGNIDAIDGQTDALGNYTVAIGKATRKKLADAFLGSDQFKKIDEWNKKMASLGRTDLKIDMSKVLDFSAKGDTSGLDKYLQDAKARATNSIRDIGVGVGHVNWDSTLFGDTVGGRIESTFGAAKDAAITASDAINQAGVEGLQAWVNGANAANNSTAAWEMTLTDVQSGIKQIQETVSQGFTMTDTIDSAASSFENLLNGIKQSGTSFNLFTEQGRKNASNFKSSVADTISLAYTMGANSGDAISIVYNRLKAEGVNVSELQIELNGLVQAGIINASTMQQIIGGTFEMSSQGKQLQAVFNSIAGSTGDISGNVAQVRTLLDYASDLSTVWKRAFDIRYSTSDALDKITEGWNAMSDAVKQADQNIKDLNNDINGLTADKKLKEYWLSVAEAYGDTINADRIRSDLAKIDSDIAKKEEERKKASDEANKSLKGNSAAAINNRNSVRGMIGNYQTYINNLAASGASQTTLNKAVKDSKNDFINQAVAMGYSRTELDTYVTSFDDMAVAINKVPKNVTVKFNNNPALQAIAELEARGKSAGSAVGASFSNSMTQAWEALQKMYAKDERRKQLETERRNLEQSQDKKRTQARQNRIDAINKLLESGSYASGGYTGTGSKYQPAGIVHKGEYVVPASQVNQTTGMPYFMSQPRSFAQGGYTGQAGPSMVMLSPEDRALLRNVGGSGEVVLYANNEAIARSSNAGNKSIVAAGGRP